jgi:DNA topoisomerase-3
VAADDFLRELQQLVGEMVQEVKLDRTVLKIDPKPVVEPRHPLKALQPKQRRPGSVSHGTLGSCPVCGQGTIIKGTQAYGCSRWKENCLFRIPMVFKNKSLTDKQ